MCAAVLAAKMQQKISQELYTVNLDFPVFIIDSEIIDLKTIAKNNTTDLPLLYCTKIMEISVLTTADN